MAQKQGHRERLKRQVTRMRGQTWLPRRRKTTFVGLRGHRRGLMAQKRGHRERLKRRDEDERADVAATPEENSFWWAQGSNTWFG